MSYDLQLRDPTTNETTVLDAKHDIAGGTYCVGGTEYAEYNITYNYYDILDKVLPPVDPPPGYEIFAKDDGKIHGIRTIYGMTGSESIPVLAAAAEQLGDELGESYWDATEGNAKKALLDCVRLATLCPNSYWDGD